MDILQTPIEYLKGIGPNRASLLKEELGIKTYQDLLHFSQTDILIERNSMPLINSQETTQKFNLKGP